MPSNKNVIKIILLIIYLKLAISHNNLNKKTFKDILDKYLGKLDFNKAYLSYEQYILLLDTLVKDFPNYLELSSIGKTYEGNEMPLIIMSSPFISKEKKINKKNIENSNVTSFKNDSQNIEIDYSLYNQSGILFTGMHHGREPVSMMMNVYLILHLLSLPRSYLHLFLSITNIYFIPIINIDTFKYNSKKYLAGSPIRNVMARKNRKPHSSKKCNSDDIGIDLNRNYDFFFAKDNKGSSNNPCEEDYRGESPFSEPETINIKNFVDSHPNIKIVYNYHSWGNLIITPFNYLKNEESNKKLKEEFPLHYKMYQDFEKEAEFPENFIFGNADKSIKYLTNGDATDWFLGQKKILSFSPELGNGYKNSEVFYPDKTITFDILEKNLYGGLYGIQKSMYYLNLELESATYSQCRGTNRLMFTDIFFNRGRYFQNNLKDFDAKNCLSDELLLNVKAKLTNKGFGDYTPGVEFPDFQRVNIKNNETIITDPNNNKKFFYFLTFDLKIDIEKVKSICFWSTLQTLYTIEINNDKDGKDKAEKEVEENQYIGKIRCINVNKGNEISDLKLFIDNKIKSMEFIILNLIIIVKKNKFIEKINKNKKRFLEIDNTKKANNYEIIKIYTKNERIIKSEKANGEIINWKFNNPSISIKIEDFIETKDNKMINKNIRKLNIYKLLILVICVIFLMTFFVFRIIKAINGRNFHELLMDNINGNRINESNNNLDINMSMNNEQIVNNLENAGQNQNINNELVAPVQIAKDENETHSNSNSNSDSPNELNA